MPSRPKPLKVKAPSKRELRLTHDLSARQPAQAAEDRRHQRRGAQEVLGDRPPDRGALPRFAVEGEVMPTSRSVVTTFEFKPSAA